MRTVVWIAAKDLRQRMRDRSALVLGFVAPLLVATLMSAAFSGADDFHADLAVADADGGAVALALTELLAGPELAEVFTVIAVDESAARSVLDDGEVDAVIVIPEGWSQAVMAGAGAELVVLATVDRPLAGEVAAAVAEGFTGQLQAVRLSVATASMVEGPTDPAAQAELAEAAAQAAERTPALELVDVSLGGRELRAISYFAPGMGIFFLFFAIGFAARGYFAERTGSTLDRMLAAPVTSGQVLAGKALSVFAYGGCSLGVMAAVTSLAFGARWGSPLAAGVLALAMVASVVALAAMVMTVARSERQADGLSSIVVFGLSLLGGNFFFVGGAHRAIRWLTLATPNGWALRGFTDLATGSPATSVVGPVLAIVAFTSVVTALAWWGARRAVVR